MPRQHVENTKEFWGENEAKRANKHADKRIIYWPPFWNKVYLGENYVILGPGANETKFPAKISPTSLDCGFSAIADRELLEFFFYSSSVILFQWDNTRELFVSNFGRKLALLYLSISKLSKNQLRLHWKHFTTATEKASRYIYNTKRILKTWRFETI